MLCISGSKKLQLGQKSYECILRERLLERYEHADAL